MQTEEHAELIVQKFDILLVDDSAADAQIFRSALEEGKIRALVYWVATGHEALEFLRKSGRFHDVGHPNVVLLDVNLPGENGFNILRSIKTDADLNRTPVLMFSTSSTQQDVDLAYSLGANSYFKKPHSLEAYVDFVRTIVRYWLDLARLPSPTSFSSRYESEIEAESRSLFDPLREDMI